MQAVGKPSTWNVTRGSIISRNSSENQSSKQRLDKVSPIEPSSLGRVGGAEGSSLRKIYSQNRSLLFTIGGLCGGFFSGVALTMIVWNGLKDRFSSGVGVEVDGIAGVDEIDGEVLGFDFSVPASGGGKVEFEDGNAAVDIGAVAPITVILAVGALFGIVVATVAWLIEKQLAIKEQGAEILKRLPVNNT